MSYKFMNVVFIENDQGEVLITKKLKGIGAGKYNGPGGKVEELPDGEGKGKIPAMSETIRKSAVREVYEETSLIIDEKDLVLSGSIKVNFEDEPEKEFIIFLYRTKEFKGEPKVPEAEREKLEGWQWIKREQLEKILEAGNFLGADKEWPVHVLNGEILRGLFRFNNSQEFMPVGCKTEIVKRVKKEVGGEVSKLL
jgi:8-oxo-dGTP diphosphatase